MTAKLQRREVVKTLLKNRGDLLVIAGLGAAAWDITAVGDNPLNFPLWGAMGGAAMMGLGLALAQPRRNVLVITGDGEQLMGLGSLATIGIQQPKNLRIVVLDNEHYGETGHQETHTAHGVDLAGIAAACGFPQTQMLTQMDEVVRLRHMIHQSEELLLAVIKIALTDDPLVLPPRDGVFLKSRFRIALLGEDSVLS